METAGTACLRVSRHADRKGGAPRSAGKAPPKQTTCMSMDMDIPDARLARPDRKTVESKTK
jgi:hypothetical protein